MTLAAVAGAYKGGPYGAAELKSLYQKYWLSGLSIAVTIHLAIVGVYYLVGMLYAEEPPPPSVRHIICVFPPPPPIAIADTPPSIVVASPGERPKAGVAVPVPDATVSAEQTIAAQGDMNQAGPLGDAIGDGDIIIPPGGTIEEAPPPFVPVEREPVVVRRAAPEYPKVAILAGLEGKVWVKIWVDKEGKSKQVVVLKSDAEIFNEPAIEAAKQFVFTPAYMNNGPVAVWVSVPFTFTLKDRR